MTTKRIYKITRIILIIIPIIFLNILIYKHLVPPGYLRAEYDFCHESSFISELSPDGRVLSIEKDKKTCSQRMVIDPVYFDVRLPQSFSKAQITLIYKKDFWRPLKVGVRTSLNDWQWYLKEVVSYDLQAGWYSGWANFDLAQAVRDNNRLRFLISSPDLDTAGEEIIFDKIVIEFEKEPLDIKSVPSYFSKIFKKFTL